MNEEPKKKSHAGTVVTLLLLLPVLYALSYGPVWRIYKETVGPVVVFRFYQPLGWACRHSDWVDKTMDAYMRWWGIHESD